MERTSIREHAHDTMMHMQIDSNRNPMNIYVKPKHQHPLDSALLHLLGVVSDHLLDLKTH